MSIEAGISLRSRGSYLFGDYCSGEIFAIPVGSGAMADNEPRVLRKSRMRISSFGEDEAGEVYVVDHRGSLHRLGPPSAPLGVSRVAARDTRDWRDGEGSRFEVF